MKNRHRLAIAAVTGVVLVGLIAAGASARSTAPAKQSASKIKACALLPDTKSSTPIMLLDAPYLKAAFAKAKIPAQVLNALNDPQKQKSQAQQCLAKGAKVILLDQINSASGNTITNLAVSSGAKVIDYDRLVVGSEAAYYVSFDNVRVGRLMGTGLVAALKANGKYSKHPVVGRLNGGVTDNNAHLFRQGYNSVLNPLYNNGTFKKAQGDDQYSNWDPIKGRRRSSTRCSPATGTTSTRRSPLTTVSPAPSSMGDVYVLRSGWSYSVGQIALNPHAVLRCRR